MSRKLVTIRKITDTTPIEGADRIEEVSVDGWSVVAQKGMHTVGDIVVYFEIDSFLPESDSRYESFMKFGTRTFEGVVGHKVKTVRLKGVYSQGIIMPLSEFPEITNPEFDVDYSEVLGIKKWEAPESFGKAGKLGDSKGNFPWFLRKSDQERIQNIYGKLSNTHHNKEFVGTLKMDGCFLGKTLLETWDGDSISISEIVNNGIRPKLIGVDNEGNIVPCEVTEVFNNGVKRDWLLLEYEPYQKSNIVGKGGSLKVTPNHKIFLEDLTEINAVDLKSGDKILMQQQVLDDNALHYVYSALLGDGCVCGKHGKGNFFTESKLKKYTEYFCILEEAYGDLFITTNNRKSGYGSEITYLNMKRTSDMDEIRNKWYVDGKKKLPEDLDWLDDFSLAKWYIDDGSLMHSDLQNDRAYLASNAFSLQDVNRLKTHLEERWGLSVAIQESKGFSLRINYAEGKIQNFWKAIARYIPNEFKYKLPEMYRNVQFIGYPKMGIKRKLVPTRVKDVTVLPYNKTNFPNGSVGYDIETTTHNYFCNGLLVHNSSVTVFYVDGERYDNKGLGICSRNLEVKYDPELPSNEQGRFVEGALYSDLFNKVKQLHELYGSYYAIQGELVGEGIQKTFEKFTEYQVFAYNIFDIVKQEYVTYEMFEEMAFAVDLQIVPVIYQAQHILREDLKTILELADGEGLKAPYREGIVWRQIDGSVSFKSISNRYLEKQD